MTTGRDDNHDGLAIDRPVGVPRNNLQGPGYAALDLRWSRDFFLVKSRKEKGPTVTAGLDAFNVFNRVNYAGFVGNLSSPFFGKAVAAKAQVHNEVERMTQRLPGVGGSGNPFS